MIPIKILNGFSEINETLVKYNSENIEFLYISIGSKFNEQRVMLDKTINNTNALYQMIPQFLQNPENESGNLVINVFLLLMILTKLLYPKI